MNKKVSKKTEIQNTPVKVTSVAQDYFKFSSKNLGLFNFVINIAITGDFGTYIARKTLDNQDYDKDMDPSILAEKEPGPRTRQLRQYRQEFLQAFFARFVDNFEVYLVDILREVLRKKPEILHSNQQTISLEHILQFNSIDDLLLDIIESKVNSLSYKGFLDLEQWYKDKGIPLSVRDEHRQVVIESIATRNIITHNRGRVDEKYLRTMPTSNYKIGELRVLQVDDLFSTLSVLDEIVSSTDLEIAQKFNLTTNDTDNKYFYVLD